MTRDLNFGATGSGDLTKYIPDDLWGELQAYRFRRESERLRSEAESGPPGLSQFRTDAAALGMQPPPGQAEGLRFAGDAFLERQDADARYTDLQRKAMAYSYAPEPTEKEHQSALQAVGSATLGFLNRTMEVMDTPRRWTWEHFLAPAVEAATGEKMTEMTGRELYLAIGGRHAQQWQRERLRDLGLPEVLSLGPEIIAGLGLQVLLDPVSYVTLGAGTGVRLGGRVLARGGEELLATALKAGATSALAAEKGGALQAALRAGRLVGDEGVAAAGAAEKLLEGAEFTYPEIDRTFSMLRSIGADAGLFKSGGFSIGLEKGGLLAPHKPGWGVLGWQLPMNTAHIRIPLLNKEEGLGVFLGGREVTPAAFKKFDDLRTSMIDLGEAALARVPLAKSVLQTGLGGAAGAAIATIGGAPAMLPVAAGLGALAGNPKAREGLRELFVNYGFLNGWGRGMVSDLLKRAERMPRAQQDRALREIGELSLRAGGVDQTLRQQRSWYLSDLGAPVLDEAGQVVRISFEDRAREIKDFTTEQLRSLGRLAEDDEGELRVVLPGGDTRPLQVPGADDIEEQVKGQVAGLQHALEMYQQTPDLPKIRLQDIPSRARPAELRPRKPIYGGPDGRTVLYYEDADALAPHELVQWELDQALANLTSKTLPQRMETRALLASSDPEIARLAEQVEPDERLRDWLAEAYRVENEELGLLPGPIGAITKLAVDQGQVTLLPNYMRHIYLTDTAGISRRVRQAAEQLKKTRPANIGKRRGFTQGLQPETLGVLGMNANPDVVWAKTLAQYRTLEKEASFVDVILHNFGKAWDGVTQYDKSEFDEYRPREWFTKALPSPDEFSDQVQTFRAGEMLNEDQANVLLNLVASRRAAGARAQNRANLTYLVPKDIKKALEVNRQVVANAPGFFAAADAGLGLMRSLVTVTWPSYHVRNYIGNLVNSHLGGVSAWNTELYEPAAALIGGYKKGGLNPTVKKLLVDNFAERLGIGQLDSPESAASAARGVLGAAPTAPFPPTTAGALGVRGNGGAIGDAELLDGVYDWLVENGGLKSGQAAIDTAFRGSVEGPVTAALKAAQEGKWSPFRKGRDISEATDNVMRARHFLGRLSQGDSPEAALGSLKKFLFDYSDLSPFEQKVLRPWAYFYTWTRKNIPLQLEMLATEPRSGQYWNALFQNVTDPKAKRDADAALLPAWIREQLGLVMARDADNRLLIVSSLGLPLDDLNQLNAMAPDQLVRRILGMGNPLVQLGAAAAGAPTGFTDRTVNEEVMQNYYRRLSPLFAQAVQLVPGLQNLVGLQERELPDGRKLYSADPWAVYLLYNTLALGKAFRTGESIFQKIPTALVQGKTSEVTSQVLQLTTGVRAAPVDLSRSVEALAVTPAVEEIDARTSSKLEAAATQFSGGDISAGRWREQRKDILSARQHQRDLIRLQQLQAEGARQPTGEGAEAIERVRTQFRSAGGQLLETIFNMDPYGDNPATGRPFQSAREYAELRQVLIDRLGKESPEDAKNFESLKKRWIEKLPPKAREVERDYQLAVELLSAYEEVPKYKGFTEDEERQADATGERLRQVSRDVGPQQARAILMQNDPAGMQLLARARRVANRSERQRVWRELNKQGGGVLARFFGSLPDEDLSAIAALQAAST